MSGNEHRATLEAWLREAYGEEGGCPPPEAFLDLAEGALPEPAAARLAAHAGACPACAAELELARAFASGEAGEGFDEETLAGVVAEVERRLPVGPSSVAENPKVLPFAKPAERPKASPSRPSRGWMPWAAAAMLFLVAGLAYRGLRPPMPELPAPESGGVVRGGEVELLAPLGDRSELPLELRWAPYPGAAAYRVRLVAVDDAVLWEGESGEPRIALPKPVLKTLHRAVAYRWMVEAQDSDRRPLAVSETGRFRARPLPPGP